MIKAKDARDIALSKGKIECERLKDHINSAACSGSLSIGYYDLTDGAVLFLKQEGYTVTEIQNDNPEKKKKFIIRWLED